MTGSMRDKTDKGLKRIKCKLVDMARVKSVIGVKNSKGERECAGHLVLASLLNIRGVDAHLLVVLLEGGKVLTGLRELTLLHTLTDVPVDEGTLRVEEVELVVEAAPCGRDGGGVRQHAQTAGDLRKIATGDMGGWLIADTELEASGAPVNELDRTLCLDDSNSSVDVLGDDITTVEKRARHCSTRQNQPLDNIRGYILYLPSLGSHLTIWLPVSKHEKVMSATEFCSW